MAAKSNSNTESALTEDERRALAEEGDFEDVGQYDVSEDEDDDGDEYDLTNIPAKVVVPVGVYDFQITRSEFGYSKANNKKIEVRCTILGGDYDGHHIYHTFTFVPDNPGLARRVSGELALIGVPLSGKYRDLATALEDATFRAKTKIETYNNEESAKIDRILGSGADSSAKSKRKGFSL